MKRLQDGFAAAEALLIIVILAVIGGTGWYVYHARQATNSTFNNVANTQVAVKPATHANNCNYRMSVNDNGGAAGTLSQKLVFTNTSKSTCILQGYPKVTASDTSGTQVSPPASNDTTSSPAPVTVPPQASVESTVLYPNPVINKCTPTYNYVDATVPGTTTQLKAQSPALMCPLQSVTPIKSSVNSGTPSQ